MNVSLNNILMEDFLKWKYTSWRSGFTLFLLIITFTINAQQIGIGTEVPDGTAVVDIISTNKGILIPRMTTVQRLSIEMPATGLWVYDITTSSFWYHANGTWTELNHWVQNGSAIVNENIGDVGIGMMDPTTPLDVLGTIRALRPGTTPDGSFISLTSPSGDPGIIITRGDGSGGERRRWDLRIDNDESFRIYDNTADKLRLMVDTMGGVGIGTSAPHLTSALDVNSTTKGLLLPRMSRAMRDSIVSPPEGLIVHCNNCGSNGQLQVFNGSNWTNIIGGVPAGVEIGDNYNGGIVAYIYQPGDPGYVDGEIHGLIATPEDLLPSIWGCYSQNLPGCEGTILGTGSTNTQKIVDHCYQSNIAGKNCYTLMLNGYNDWFLPSKDELYKLYLNRNEIGGFQPVFY